MGAVDVARSPGLDLGYDCTSGKVRGSVFSLSLELRGIYDVCDFRRAPELGGVPRNDKLFGRMPHNSRTSRHGWKWISAPQAPCP